MTAISSSVPRVDRFFTTSPYPVAAATAADACRRRCDLLQYKSSRSIDTSTSKEFAMLIHPARLSAFAALVAILVSVGGCQTNVSQRYANEAGTWTGDASQDISALIDQYTKA